MSRLQHLANYPRLVSAITLSDVSTSNGNQEAIDAIDRTLSRLDGTKSIRQIATLETALSLEETEQLVETLDRAALIDDDGEVPFHAGSDVILDLEELMEECCSTTIYQNPFWRACLSAKRCEDLPEKLVLGMIIENWQFLFRETYFDAPVLSFVPNTAVRLLLNQFFAEEYGHDEILMRALNFAGLSREEMMDSIPLPETMGLCNALSYWAHNDPLFFFATLGLLEGQSDKQDSFIGACERIGVSEGLVGPLKTHASINRNSEHGSLGRAIFRQIPAIDDATFSRLKSQVPLFVQLYDHFYSGVWRHYRSNEPLLRRVSKL